MRDTNLSSVAVMRLTRFTDVALRVLMRLAVVENEDPPTTREVAAAMQVPYSHAAKVVARLQHLGLVEARRGRGGGLALAPGGLTASVGGLVRELEGPGDVVECEGATPARCGRRAGCAGRCARRRKPSTPRSTRSPSRNSSPPPRDRS